jgi:hypothetical protein
VNAGAKTPPRWLYALVSVGILVLTALLVYAFECKISG